MKSKILIKREVFFDWLGSFAFVVPALFFYIVFLVIPMFGTARISLHKWNGANPTMDFVGLANYVRIFSDAIFYKALLNNVIWIAFTICIPVTLGLILAVLIGQKYIRRKLIFRVTYFMPNIISLVAVGIVWGWIYNPEFGILVRFLTAIGVPNAASLDFLGSESLVIWSLVVAGSWTCFGFNMVVFMAALQSVDNAYLEAADLEGASFFQKLFLIILPSIKSTITLLVLNSLIGSFHVFDLIYIMTKGGPYHSSEVVATYMFTRSFQMNEYGYGSALAMVLAVIISICTSFYLYVAEQE